MSWGEIKKALNSTLGDSGFKALNELIRDDFTTVSEWLSTGNVPIVKSVQRGTIQGSSKTSASNRGTTISINTINPNKALVIIDYVYGGKDDTSYYDYEPYIEYSVTVNANSIYVSDSYYLNHEGNYSSGNYYAPFNWQVIEFY